MNQPICKFCQNPFEGRRDKQFCGSSCKNDYYKANGFPLKGIDQANTIPTVAAAPVAPVAAAPIALPPSGGNDMMQMLYLEAKALNQSLADKLETAKNELFQLKIEKGTWDKLRELDDAKKTGGLSGIGAETEKEVVMELLDMGKMYMAKKMNMDESVPLLEGISEDGRTLIEGMLEQLKSLDNENLAAMNLIVDYYANNGDGRAAFMQQYSQFKKQAEPQQNPNPQTNPQTKTNVSIY